MMNVNYNTNVNFMSAKKKIAEKAMTRAELSAKSWKTKTKFDNETTDFCRDLIYQYKRKIKNLQDEAFMAMRPTEGDPKISKLSKEIDDAVKTIREIRDENYMNKLNTMG